ncbi:MAG: sugar phosphate isomerase/epimerase [Chloroflexaceae bacterium]|nr:sugar phosphate isomerase/epimerase [Chloroflexaceae bacterium]
MQLGMMNDPRRDACEEARWAGEHGFTFLDLTLEGPGAAPEQIDITALRQILHEYQMAVVGHTAWYLPFNAPIKSLRQAAIDYVVDSFDLFAEMGVHWVNVHIAQGVYLFSNHDRMRWNGESFAELAERAEPYGLRIMVEHPPEASMNISDIRHVLDMDERLGFHLDVGHANIGGHRLEGLLQAFGSRLAHVHLSDNRGRNDDHIPLGTGSIDWPRAIRLIRKTGYDHTITLEVFSADRDYLLLSAQKVRTWWQQAETEG